MTWLKGGPYYELSILIRNIVPKVRLLTHILKELNHLDFPYKIIDSETEVAKKVDLYEIGERDDNLIRREFDIDAEFEISGKRKARIFIAELSNDLIKANFLFFGGEQDEGEWNQIGIKNEDKSEFRRFFDSIIKKFNPILGTIGYEVDCIELFELNETYPNVKYTINELSIDKIQRRINKSNYEFEYCWVNGNEFNENSNFEFELNSA